MGGSKCPRCGFIDWVEAVQCKQCGLSLSGPDYKTAPDEGTRQPDPKRFSRFGLALSFPYLLIVALIVGSSFTCGRFGGDRWPAILYCLGFTLTMCSFPWPFLLGVLLRILNVSAGAALDWVILPYSVLGISANAILLYKFGKEVMKDG